MTHLDARPLTDRRAEILARMIWRHMPGKHLEMVSAMQEDRETARGADGNYLPGHTNVAMARRQRLFDVAYARNEHGAAAEARHIARAVTRWLGITEDEVPEGEPVTVATSVDVRDNAWRWLAKGPQSAAVRRLELLAESVDDGGDGPGLRRWHIPGGGEGV